MKFILILTICMFGVFTSNNAKAMSLRKVIKKALDSQTSTQQGNSRLRNELNKLTDTRRKLVSSIEIQKILLHAIGEEVESRINKETKRTENIYYQNILFQSVNIFNIANYASYESYEDYENLNLHLINQSNWLNNLESLASYDGKSLDVFLREIVKLSSSHYLDEFYEEVNINHLKYNEILTKVKSEIQVRYIIMSRRNRNCFSY